MPFAGHFVPGGYLKAAGQVLQIADHETLFQLIGTAYGGDGNTFQLPDLRGRTIIGACPQLPLGTTERRAEAVLFDGNLPVSVGGSGQPIDNQEPSLALTYLIALQGFFPSPNGGGFSGVEPSLGEVMAVTGVSHRKAGRWRRVSSCQSTRTRPCSRSSAPCTAATGRQPLRCPTCAAGR